MPVASIVQIFPSIVHILALERNQEPLLRFGVAEAVVKEDHPGNAVVGRRRGISAGSVRSQVVQANQDAPYG